MFVVLFLHVTCIVSTFYTVSYKNEDDQTKLAFFIHKDLQDKIDISVKYIDNKINNAEYSIIKKTDKLYSEVIKTLSDISFDEINYDLYCTNINLPLEGIFSLRITCKKNKKIYNRLFKKKDLKGILSECTDSFLYYIKSYNFLKELVNIINENLKNTGSINDDFERIIIDKEFIELKNVILSKISRFDMWADNYVSRNEIEYDNQLANFLDRIKVKSKTDVKDESSTSTNESYMESITDNEIKKEEMNYSLKRDRQTGIKEDNTIFQLNFDNNRTQSVEKDIDIKVVQEKDKVSQAYIKNNIDQELNENGLKRKAIEKVRLSDLDHYNDRSHDIYKDDQSCQSNETIQSPSQSNEIFQSPSQRNETIQSPSQSNETIQSPSQSNETNQSPSQCNELSQRPSQSNELSQSPSQSNELQRNNANDNNDNKNKQEKKDIATIQQEIIDEVNQGQHEFSIMFINLLGHIFENKNNIDH